MSVAILGSGAFGTALAISLSQKSPTLLWSRSSEQAQRMCESRENETRLPGVTLPKMLTITADLEDVSKADTVLLAIPMQKLRDALFDAKPALEGKTLVACCKGIELQSGLGPVALVSEVLPSADVGLLTGPSFASDIARGLPTALTLAFENSKLCTRIQAELTTANLRLYRTIDVRGAEVGGALKNVMAIACGAVMGAGLGDSARAAIMTRGYAEMQRMALRLGAHPDTLAGLSGFGDLALTCTSELSRNYQLGLSIGRNECFDPSITVEGAATARAVSAQADAMGVEMPITECVTGLVNKDLTLDDAIAQLLSRPLKEE